MGQGVVLAGQAEFSCDPCPRDMFLMLLESFLKGEKRRPCSLSIAW